MENSRDNKKFSIIPKLKNSTHAWRGFFVLLKSSPNTTWLLVFGLLAVYLGFILNISSTEWILVVLTIGLVVVAEAINTAIEIDIDLTSPEYHPYAKDTKDVAAAAVLFATFIASIVGVILFLPKIL